ncbi:MAG TPA: AAA family ATPase [Candidatus Acidoferrum sp.]|jgi:ATP-dependent 26S proteasome regulatory subunit
MNDASITAALPSTRVAPQNLPAWAQSLVERYESNAANQFLLYGNIADSVLLQTPNGPRLGALSEFLLSGLLNRFDVVLSYDLGNGIRIEKGAELFSKWPAFQESQKDWKAPRPAVESLTRYFRFCANLARLNQPTVQVGCIINNADLLVPPAPGGLDYNLNALASLIRDWANDSLLTGHALATFLLTENINDLHPLIVNNPRVARIKIELPSVSQIGEALQQLSTGYGVAMSELAKDIPAAAAQLAGTTLSALESVVKAKQHRKESLVPIDLAEIKKELVESDTNGLIEFLKSGRTLNDVQGLDSIKAWLRQDIELWRKNDTAALPKGYLFCGPVGTGKTFLVECLAGEASVPVVKMKNFRDKWVGTSEGNLEKIFRLIHALGRCYVFIDEADQTLGRRDASSGDSGVSGRIYSMLAEEMGNSSNRGSVIWILASSRPDLIEVDLKRPGRVDFKIPLFPTSTKRESFDLLRMLLKKRGLDLEADRFAELEPDVPLLLTPGAAEALAVKIYRLVRTSNLPLDRVLLSSLGEYQNPVPPDIMRFQINLAVAEASDLDFVPTLFRPASKPAL